MHPNRHVDKRPGTWRGTGTISCTYPTAGPHTITVEGNLIDVAFGQGLVEIETWGDTQIRIMDAAFSDLASLRRLPGHVRGDLRCWDTRLLAEPTSSTLNAPNIIPPLYGQPPASSCTP